MKPSRNELTSVLNLYQNGIYNGLEDKILSLIEKYPDNSFLWKLLGLTYKKNRKLNESLHAQRQSILLNPNDYESHNNLGVLLFELGDRAAAEDCHKRAIKLNPNFAEPYANLGNIFFENGMLNESKNNFKIAIKLKPNKASFYSNLGNIYKDGGFLIKAISHYKKAISLKPDFSSAYCNLGNTLRDIGNLDDAIKSYKKALEIDPNYKEVFSNLLFLKSSVSEDSKLYLKEAKKYGHLIKNNTKKKYSNWDYEKDIKKLKVGFVSNDLKNHPVGYFLESLFLNLENSSLELFAYSNNLKEDELSSRIKPKFVKWTQIANKKDSEAAKLIYNDNINILIDLSGHTSGNRLPIFAMKPSPIQLTWLGYWASTGLNEIDYILGDPFVTPKKEKNHFIEKIWQLPEIFSCFSEPNFSIDLASLPAIRNGYITFGCFNNLTKMTNEVIKVRSEILKKIPGSRLFLKNKQLEDELTRKKVIEKYAKYEINSERLILEGRSSRKKYLETYNQIDISLSPFPFGGSTTTIEGLWMGVPALVKKGDNFISHIGESILHNSHLSDWICQTNDDYIDKAIMFSSDIKKLKKLKKNLRNHNLSSIIFNSKKFSINFENALWEMWNKYEKSKK